MHDQTTPRAPGLDALLDHVAANIEIDSQIGAAFAKMFAANPAPDPAVIGAHIRNAVTAAGMALVPAAELEAAHSDRAALPTPAEIKRYLADRGWTQVGAGPVGTMWAGGKDGRRIAVADEPDESFMRGVLGRIARAEQRTVTEVLAGMREVTDRA